MIDVFNAQFSPKIDVFKYCGKMQLSLLPEFHITVVYDYGYIFLIDENKTNWAYAKNGWTIEIPGFYCEDLPIGKHFILGQAFIRVSNPEEIMAKIEKCLKPYIIQHIWDNDIYCLNLN